ncbi:MAG: hypothetical protein V1706_10170 [Pseudomonadota bacterium]
MAEKAAVFGGMVRGQWGFTLGIMAFFTELFRFLFTHGVEALMVFVMGQKGSGFRWRIPEKEKSPAAEENENEVVDQEIFFLFVVHGFNRLLLDKLMIEKGNHAVIIATLPFPGH